MNDIEKNRVEYVADLEAKLEHAVGDVAKYKPLAEKWEPKAAGTMEPDNKEIRVVLAFGGKRITATFPVGMFVNNNTADITNAVCETMIKNLVIDQLRAVVHPEVTRLSEGAKAVSGAGKW